MYKVKESDYRALKMIEESVIQKILQTKKTCPNHMLYLEMEMIPTRYQIERQVLNFLQYTARQELPYVQNVCSHDRKTNERRLGKFCDISNW